MYPGIIRSMPDIAAKALMSWETPDLEELRVQYLPPTRICKSVLGVLREGAFPALQTLSLAMTPIPANLTVTREVVKTQDVSVPARSPGMPRLWGLRSLSLSNMVVLDEGPVHACPLPPRTHDFHADRGQMVL